MPDTSATGPVGPELDRQVLLVEGDAQIAAFIRASLGPRDVVHLAKSVNEALSVLAAPPAPLDLAVVSLPLPDGSGLEVLDALGDLAAVVLYGAKDPASIEEARARGVDDHVSKDHLTADSLRRAIDLAAERARSRRLRRQLEHASRLNQLGHMAAALAHEIGNPLTFVRSNLQILREDAEQLLVESSQAQAQPSFAPSRIEELVSMIEEASLGTERIARLIRQLRAFSLPSSGGLRHPTEPVDLVEVARSSVALARSRLEQAAVVIAELPGDPIIVDAQPERVSQVITNFLLNAAQAIEDRPSEPRKGRIEVRVVRHAQEGEVTVVDDGHGIPAHLDIAQLFDPFMSTRTATGGTGLGLAVSSEIARSLGGSVELERRRDGVTGARASLVLPLRRTSTLPEPNGSGPDTSDLPTTSSSVS